MQDLLTEIVVHLSQSHQYMARILDAKRQETIRMSQLVMAIPDVHPELNGLEGLMESSSDVTKSVIAYVNGLADLHEALADGLGTVVKAADIPEEE